MNRIREVNGIYQVLINQNYRTNPAIELTLGSLLSEEYLRDYEVKEFNNMQDAMNLAFNLPAIDFNKIRSDCIDCFKKLNKEIFKSIEDVIKIYQPYLLTQEEIKNAIFDRVINNGRRFTFYNFNDVIAFDIVINYPSEIPKIIDLILMNKNLRIVKKVITSTHTKLIGLTENNITYEIRIWTHEVRDMMKWLFVNKKNPYDYMQEIGTVLAREKDKISVFI